jgi:hypothetical protein
MNSINFRFITRFVIVFFLTASVANAVQLLAGDTSTINGVTSFQQPSLVGLVVRDELISFEIIDDNGEIILSGLLEDKVVKSSDLGTFIFQSRFRELSNTKPNQITKITSTTFGGYSNVVTDPDYLLNGIGDNAPTRVQRAAGVGDRITFHYDIPVAAPQNSSFTTIETNATEFEVSGEVVITAESGGQSFSTTIITSAPSGVRSAIFPQQGLWWNPLRSGHGIDVEVIGGDTLLVIWYTYRDDKTPIWYLGSSSFSGDSWEGSMDAFNWDGQRATGQSTGQFGLDFSDPSHATFWWQFAGEQRQQEPFEILPIGASSDTTTIDYSGTYFEPAKPGYGLTLGVQGNAEISVLYFYDADGRATWAIGSKDSCDETSYQLKSLQGFCPDCPAVVPTSVPVGVINPVMLAFNRGILTANVILQPPLSGSWNVENARISNLSFQFN